MSYAERIADNNDPLRVLLQVARKWGVPPSVFIRQRTVNSTEWTDEDTRLALALDDYEAGLCPGGNHVLAETSRPEHADAYRPAHPPHEWTRCHYCTASAALSEVIAKQTRPEGLSVPLVLDPEIVARNRLPVPPLPPELRQP